MKAKLKKFLGVILIIAMFLLTVASFTVEAQITDVDSDGDNLPDTEEDKNGDGNITKGETDPYDPDTDDDGITDKEDNNPNKENELLQFTDDAWDRRDAANSLLNTFLFVLLLSFAVFSLLAGIFTAYFGAGKSRAIGGGLLLLGLIVILIWVYFGLISSYPDDTLIGVIHWEAANTLEAFATVVGALIGAVVAIVLFLVAIMKS
jgi:hypothetical protein